MGDNSSTDNSTASYPRDCTSPSSCRWPDCVCAPVGQQYHVGDLTNEDIAWGKSQTTNEPDVVVTKNPDGYVTIDLTMGARTFYIEVGETRYSGYLKGVYAETKYFEGDADAAE